jgi:hypothetical protein
MTSNARRRVVEIGSVATIDDAESGGRASETVAVGRPDGRTRTLRIVSVATST